MIKVNVRSGIDVLPDIKHEKITGRRLGVITNPTGLTSDFRSSIEVIAGLPGSELTALFACEHGLRGQLQAGKHVDDEVDPVFGVPVYSLYGSRRKPDADMLKNVDTVIFDVQDLGVRFYTYMTTLLYVMEACAEHGKSLLVLDRPNPLGGERCEGGFLKPGYESMVGGWHIPINTGMTIGEFARMANDMRGTGCDLDVIRLEGWTRGMEYTDTGLPWVLPSPNIPTMDTVRLYSGTCFFEGTNLSEGRGRPGRLNDRRSMGQWGGAGPGVQRIRTARRPCPFHVHDPYLLEASGRRLRRGDAVCDPSGRSRGCAHRSCAAASCQPDVPGSVPMA